MLQILGLDAEAECVYRLLLTRPGLGTAGLAAELGRPGGEIRRVLARLADLALVTPSWRSADVVRLLSPEVALHALLARKSAELLSLERDLAGARVAVEELLGSYRAAAPEPEGALAPERLVGLDATCRRLGQVFRETSDEGVAFAPGGPLTEDTRRLGRPIAEDARKRGVGLRTIYLDSLRNDPESVAYVHWLLSLGARIRTVPTLPLWMQIVDRRMAFVPSDLRNSGTGAVLLKEPGAVAGLVELFEHVWRDAAPFADVPPPLQPVLATPRERALLRLLADGLTDEAAARRLGVSLRTERRMITDLMERLGATSRFQLGRRAAEQGLLPTGTQ
jgi:DNA-binding CsgD family transcriptional regulator